MYNSNKIQLLSYNVHGSYNLANLYLILEITRPSVVFLQEVKLSSEQVKTFGRRLNYTGVANIDELDSNKPGTAILWHTSVPVSQVVSLYPCRIQVAMLGVYPLINVYVPAGSHRANERRQFFTEQLFGLMAGYEGILPVCGGDWNTVLAKIDLEDPKYFQDRKSVDLSNIVNEFGLIDTFRHLYRNKKEYTWQGRDGASASRLDRFYIPEGMVECLVDVSHHAGYSDHKYVVLELNLPDVKKLPKKLLHDSGFWKLNTAVLDERNFMVNFKALWEALELDKEKYPDVADWWDLCAKKEIREFLQHFSATRQRVRRELKQMLCFMLDRALDKKDYNEVAMVRGRLQEMMYRDNMGFVIRSRFKENHEVERASLYHINREKKHAKVGNLSKLMINGKVETDRAKIEKEVLGFFGKLFHGHHGKNGEDMGEPFKPDYTHLDEFLEDLGKLSPNSSNIIEKPVTKEELEYALKKADNNKSPGLDGLPYEFYKKVKEEVSETLVEVLNTQLERLRLMDSNKKGATRLTPKTEPGTVPRVDQLRPITLLCADYKILTMILSNRMMTVMEEIILSGQLCSVRGKNIHFGTHNLLSAMMHSEERVKLAEFHGFNSSRAGGSVLVSYDLFKAYDRVFIGYLVKVMEAMGFGEKFISWVVMLHDGASTQFILNFLTNPLDILISVRQGDPLAMCLFIIFIEPLLMMIRKTTGGMAVLALAGGERNQGRMFCGASEQEFVQKDEAYVDDVNVVLDSDRDMIKIDEIFGKFEKMSGAILNRSVKTKCMGLGNNVGRRNWPLDWVKVEPSLKIFGVRHFPTYKETIDHNWGEAYRKMEMCINSWNTRVLNSVFQRVEVLNIFVLPKLWYLAEVLPLPAGWAAQFEKLVFSFIKMGKMEMMALAEMCNPITKGGLGLVCVRSKADSLFLKQTLRILSQKNTLHWKYARYYAGLKINEGDMHGGLHHHCATPYYDHMVDLYLEGVVLEICRYCCGKSVEDCEHGGQVKLNTTAKEIYITYTDTFPPPKVEYRQEYHNVSSVQWSRVWDRVASPMLDPMARQVVWRAIHNILPTRERQSRLGLREQDNRQVVNSNCNRCAQRSLDNVVHMFAECSLVREAWTWTRRRVLSLLPEDMSDLSNQELLLMFFPKEMFENSIVWVIGTYMNWAYEEAVMKGRILTDHHVRGYLRYMWFQSLGTKMPDVGYIGGITVMENGVFDDNG